MHRKNIFVQATENGAANVSASTSSAPPATVEKPINDVVAGAMARAASQGTIHPLDTLKVQMQVGKQTQQACEPSLKHHSPLDFESAAKTCNPIMFCMMYHSKVVLLNLEGLCCCHMQPSE